MGMSPSKTSRKFPPIGRKHVADGEDNMWVLTELLGRSPSEVARLAEEGVI